MVSLGTGYFHPESPTQEAAKAVRHFPIFKHTRPPSSIISSSPGGSEADDEATTTVSGPSSSSSSSDPSAKRTGPPVSMVSGRHKRVCIESSHGHSGGETSSLSTNTAPSIVIDEEREHFPLFTDEEDCTSIGDGRAGESFSSTTCSSPIPWSAIKLTHTASNNNNKDTSLFSAYHNFHHHNSTDKDTPMLPSYRQQHGSSSSASQAERGRQLARVLLDQARNKQAVTKRRRVTFARPVRVGSDTGSSASTSTSSSSGDHKGDHDPLDPFRPSSRHVLSKRNKVRASLLRRAVQSLRRRKDFVDNLFEIPGENEEEEKRDDDQCSTTVESSYYPSISAVTARNLAFAEWERYLPVPKVTPPTSKWSRPWSDEGKLPQSPARNSNNSTPQPSPSRISVTSGASTLSYADQLHALLSPNNNERRDTEPAHSTELPESNDWILDGLSGRTDRDIMLDQLGFLPREKMTDIHDPSKVSREAVLQTLDTLSMVWDKTEGGGEEEKTAEESLPVPPVAPRSPSRQDFGQKPTISILGVVLVNYPQLVRDQVHHFRRNVLNISDAFSGLWGATATATTTR